MHTPFTVVVPARMTSSRLPKKPLADIGGKPMIVRTAEQAQRSNAQQVVVACDDAVIVSACSEHGIQALLTNPDHPTGTDRLAEAVTLLGLPDDAIVVNVQGDEPLIDPTVINAVAELLEKDTAAVMATACYPITRLADFLNPNVVKVELDAQNRALTFSRAPLPWPRDHFRDAPKDAPLPEELPAYHHLGIYSYRVGFLKRFPTLTSAPIEKMESLEQLRALWHGYSIAVLVRDSALGPGVDTAEDLAAVRAIFDAQQQSH